MFLASPPWTCGHECNQRQISMKQKAAHTFHSPASYHILHICRSRTHSCPCLSTTLPGMQRPGKLSKKSNTTSTIPQRRHRACRSFSASGNVLTLANIFQFCLKDIFSAYRSHKSGFFSTTSQLSKPLSKF